MITPEERDELLRLAREARENAHAPYTGYTVGAAVLTTKGNYYSRCNVENATLTMTTHAEGNALTAAVGAGERSFKAILVLTDNDPPPFPGAICRQSLAEFDRGEILILAGNTEGTVRETHLGDLYPEIFGPHKLI